MVNPTSLSPAAQAVFQAYLDNCDGAYEPQWYQGDLNMIAAVLRAVVEQVVPPNQETPWGSTVKAHAAELRIRDDLLAIADELEDAQ